MYKTIFLIAFHGLFRISEVSESQHVVRAKDVNIGVNKNKLLFVLHSSKMHNKESRPQKVKITALEQGQKRKTFFCPFHLMQKYLKFRKEIRTRENGQFFVFKDGSPVRPAHLRVVLNTTIKNLGIDHRLYSFHSLRIGKASQLINLGYSVELVKRVGRWKSNAVYKYIRQ